MKLYEDLHHIDQALKFKNHTLKEWIGFNYAEYRTEIINWISAHGFEDIEDLTQQQIKNLRVQFADAFRNGEDIRQIARRVLSSGIGDLEVSVPTQYDADGNVIRQGYSRMMPKEFRSVIIARTETIRAANEGALDNYTKNMSVEKVQWLAGISDRTCDICNEENGRIMTIAEARGQIPKHCACRCAWTPLT